MPVVVHDSEKGENKAGRGDPQREEDGPGDTRPYLCIPYWEGPRSPGDPVDIGQVRPLPTGVVSWACPAIHTTPYVPGQDLDITVDVRNSGQGSATVVATVIVYWADPTVGFAKPNLFGVATVAAPIMRDKMKPGVASVTLRGQIPATAPNHVCLLACVTHSLDPAKKVIDPIGDRHWAQHNLVAVNAGTSPVIVPFLVANPFEVEELFELRARQLDREELELLSLRLKGEPGDAALHMRLVDGLGKSVTDSAREALVRVALGPKRQRRYSLVVNLEREIPEGEMLALELVLTHGGGDRGRPVGSLGIVVSTHRGVQ